MKLSKRNLPRINAEGFTLIEVLISMFILTIGLLSLLGVFGLAVSATMTSEEDGIAKQLAQDAFESIYTARDSANLQWTDIENAGANGGIFLTGFQPIYNSGNDAIYGTADDSAAGAQTLTLPGPDGIVGTADDVTVSLTNFQRQITITDVVSGGSIVPNLKTVTVTVQYTVPRSRWPKSYVLSGFISQYR
ncbi:MAG TPA: type IV pilus modification protein PilV [Terriglobales bacterium]|nr:type IV pilus modification protein PilV [Terriglobales bacterium]